jgi:uncharacterized protein (TIGR03437 family)
MRGFLFYLCFVAILVGIAPSGAFGHSYGPAPRVTGAPGDSPRACTSCHSGSALNSGSGSVNVVLQSGPFYIPGVRQRVAVQVSDPGQRRWGFELTARLNSDPEKGQAGDFTPVDQMTQVICEDNAPKPCASGPSFIEHTSAGSRNGARGSVTFQFDWTPPATNAGPVTFYVAGNAANGDNNFTGDLIYTSSVQLSPALPAAPAVPAGNVVSAATAAVGPVAPNSWLTVYGSNLGVTTRGWVESDFVNGGIPFSLDGVSVLLNQFGAPRLAYVGYVSPGQVNVLLPSDLVPTATTLQVRNPAGMSTAVPITIQANAAQLFTLDGRNVLGTHANGGLLGRAGLLPSLTTSPAAPGETIVVYATGLGATTPAQIPGQVPAEPASLVTLPQVTIGGAAATVVSGGIVPGSAGLYRISVQVPSDAATGDLPVIVRVGTASSVSTLLTVQR